jgi:hypothetical protein
MPRLVGRVLDTEARAAAAAWLSSRAARLRWRIRLVGLERGERANRF